MLWVNKVNFYFFHNCVRNLKKMMTNTCIRKPLNLVLFLFDHHNEIDNVRAQKTNYATHNAKSLFSTGVDRNNLSFIIAFKVSSL